MSEATPVYGARGTIGLIDLSTCTSLTPEVYLAIPDGVAALFSRIRLPRGEVTAEALTAMVASDALERAANELADAGVDVIVFACTSASLLLGPGFDLELSERIQAATQTPASTTASAVVAALRAVGATTLSVGTPYVDEINRRERRFLEAAGFDVRAICGLQLERDREIGALSSADVRDLAVEAGREPSDALFLSCTNLPALGLIAELEERLSRPVVTSNSTTIWYALAHLGILPRNGVLGRLSTTNTTTEVRT